MSQARERKPEVIARQLEHPCSICGALPGHPCLKSGAGIGDDGVMVWAPKAERAARRLPHLSRGL